MQKLISQIQHDKKHTFITLSILSVVFLWFNIEVLPIGLLGFVSLLIYWFIGGVWLAGIFRRVIKFNGQWSVIAGLFLMLYLISFTMAFWIVIWKISVELMVISLAGLSLVISFLHRRVTGHSSLPTSIAWRSLADGAAEDRFPGSLDELKQEAVNNGQQIKINKRIWITLVITTVFAMAFLFLARTSDYILSPWETVHPVYLYLYILISFLVFLIIFSQYRLRVILVVIILHSFLLHSYLPIVYKTGFGGDKWRHVAAERWLQDGKVYSPSLFGEEFLRVKKIGSLPIPEVFLVGNKTSYANQWGLTIALSWILGVDVFWIDIFLVFILWSIFIPLFLMKLGHFFVQDKRFLGLLAFLPGLFYPLQVYGAITIPVAFGFLYFVFVLIIWFIYLNQDRRKCITSLDSKNQVGTNNTNKTNKNFLWLLLVLTGLMYFNYLVYFILILEVGLLIVLIKKTLSSPHSLRRRLAILFFVISFCLLLVIPSLDKIGGFSNFKLEEMFAVWQWPNQLGEFILGKLFGLGEFMPLPTFVSQGNFIFMQIAREGLLSAILFKFIYWQRYISIFVWFLVIYGIIKIVNTKPRQFKFVWLLFFIVLLLSHFISLYYMDGTRLLVKRLDLVTIFFILPLLALGIYSLIFHQSKMFRVRARIVSFGLVLAVSSGVVYASGPKLEVVTDDEVKASTYIWDDVNLRRERNDTNNNFCVLANTWPLLGLEAVSRRNIVAGGFPIYTEYAQPERVQLWDKMTSDPSIRYLEKSLTITNAHGCYFMVEKKWLGVQDKEREEKLARLIKMFREHEKFGEVYVFYYER